VNTPVLWVEQRPVYRIWKSCGHF